VYNELHPILQHYLDRALQEVANISLICGHRGQKEQNEKFENKKSKVRWPHGKHNSLPSVAVDLQPYPMPTNDLKLFMALGHIAGRIIQMAATDGITIRWGGDWDRDGDVLDQDFDDLFHLEIRELPNAEKVFASFDITGGVRSTSA
jgi:hypothetical protein